MKFTKVSKRQIKEFSEMMDSSGCVSVSEWVSGSGRFASPKALPPFVTRIERGKLTDKKHLNYAIKSYFEKYPRRKAVLVLDKIELGEFLTDCALGCEVA